MKYFFRGNDFKARQWKKHLPHEEINLVGGSKISFTYYLIKHTIFKKKNDLTFVVRYLNDYKSLIKTLLIFISEVVLLCYVRITGVKLYWICHNIDAESHEYYPRITRLRRHLFLSTVNKVFVMDALFVKYAKILFKKYKIAVESTSFGRYEPTVSIHQTAHKEVLLNEDELYFKGIEQTELIKIIKKRSAAFDYIGFCAGGTLKKKVYLKEIPNLIDAAKKSGISVLMVVISDLKEVDNPELFEYLSTSVEVIFINNLMSINEHEMAGLIDFYWLGYDDISIPYTVYVAHTVKRPILSYNTGVLPIIVRTYKLGSVVSNDYSNVIEAFENLKLSPSSSKAFSKSHSWENGIRSIVSEQT